MTETRVFETTVKSFLLGVSVGTILATILKPRDNPGPAASEESFPVERPNGEIFDIE